MPAHGGANAYETSVFKYNYEELLALGNATFILSVLSLFSSVLIIGFYIYMLIRHKKRANRVSLRCVFLCSIADTLTAILNIAIIFEKGDSHFCRASSVIIVSTNIMSTTLLTIVGLNLMLIFVLNVNRKDLLERFYYPVAFIYTAIGTIVPLYQEVNKPSSEVSQLRCWYWNYIEDRTYNMFSWMWYYSFLFFVNIIAIVCSVAAMAKLVKEQHILKRKMETLDNCSSLPTHHYSAVKQQQNNVFTKVVLRCIIYPLVPFLVNIFGFILQMVITASHDNPSFALAMLDIVFSCIQGVFVAFVFFTDPAVTELTKLSFKKWYRIYVEEYVIIDKITITANNTYTTSLPTSPFSPTSEHSTATTTTTLQSPCKAVVYIYSGRYIDIHAQPQLTSSESRLLSIPYNNNNNNNNNMNNYFENPTDTTNTHTKKTKTPMRRLKMTTHNNYNRPTYHPAYDAISPPLGISELIQPDDDDDDDDENKDVYYTNSHRNNNMTRQKKRSEIPDTKYVYIPYTQPAWLVRCFHWILRGLHFKKRKNKKNNNNNITNSNNSGDSSSDKKKPILSGKEKPELSWISSETSFSSQQNELCSISKPDEIKSNMSSSSPSLSSTTNDHQIQQLTILSNDDTLLYNIASIPVTESYTPISNTHILHF